MKMYLLIFAMIVSFISSVVLCFLALDYAMDKKKYIKSILFAIIGSALLSLFIYIAASGLLYK